LRVTGRVAAQREHVADAGVGVLPDHPPQLCEGVVDRGEMAERGQRGLVRDPLGDGDRRVARGAARTVGDGDERGLQHLELAQRLPQLPFALGRLRREELERVGPLAPREQLADGVRPRRRRTVGESLRRDEGHRPRLRNGGILHYPILATAR
jgi:hypothetical protein